MPFSPLEINTLWDGGANTRQLNDAIQKNESPYPLNVQFEGKKIAKAPGYSVFGTETDSTLVGYNLYNHRVLSTEEVMIKVIGTKVKYYDEVTSTWQLLSSTAYTTGEKWWFASFNSYLYGGNGTDSLQRWPLGSWATLANPVLIGATTIDLEAGTGQRFASTGSGLIEGDTFAWTGKSGDQLTGVSGITSDHIAGRRLTVEPTAYASAPKGSLGCFYRNRLYIVPTDTSNFVNFSKLADNTNPHDDLVNFTVTGAGSGDAGFFIADATVLDLRQYLTGGNDPVLIAFCANGTTYVLSVSDISSVTSGIIVPFKVDMEDIAGKNLSAVTENDLIFVGKSGAMRAVTYGESSSILKTSRLSDEVMNVFSKLESSNGDLEYFDRRLFMTCKKDGASENNFVVMKDTNPNGFLFWDYYNANCFCEWKDRLYFLSSVNGNVYKMFDGRSAAGSIIASSYPTQATDFNAPLILKLLSRIRLQGQISEGCILNIEVYFDDSLMETFSISGSDTNIIAASSGAAIGKVIFGTGSHASGDSNVPIRKNFVAEWNMKSYKYFYKVNLEYSNNQSDVDFLLDKQLLFAEVANQDTIFSNKIL
jgi:hypothetical protein